MNVRIFIFSLLFSCSVIASNQSSYALTERCLQSYSSEVFEYNFSGQWFNPNTWMGSQYNLSLKMGPTGIKLHTNWGINYDIEINMDDFSIKTFRDDLKSQTHDFCTNPLSTITCTDFSKELFKKIDHIYLRIDNQAHRDALQCLKLNLLQLMKLGEENSF